MIDYCQIKSNKFNIVEIISRPGSGCPIVGEFVPDDCWLEGYHEEKDVDP